MTEKKSRAIIFSMIQTYLIVIASFLSLSIALLSFLKLEPYLPFNLLIGQILLRAGVVFLGTLFIGKLIEKIITWSFKTKNNKKGLDLKLPSVGYEE